MYEDNETHSPSEMSKIVAKLVAESTFQSSQNMGPSPVYAITVTCPKIISFPSAAKFLLSLRLSKTFPSSRKPSVTFPG